MDIYGEYFGKPVEAVSDDELLEAIYSLEGAYQGGAIDEPEMYITWYNEAHALNEEALKRGLGCQFEVFMDCDEEDPEEDIKLAEDYPPFDDDNDFRADYIDYITERRAIEGPVEWF